MATCFSPSGWARFFTTDASNSEKPISAADDDHRHDPQRRLHPALNPPWYIVIHAMNNNYPRRYSN